METSNFDRLLNRYLNGETSEQETAKIEAWLDVMKTENTSGLKLGKEDEERLFQKIMSNKDNVEEIRTIVPEKKKLSSLGWTMRIAATLIVVALVSYISWTTGKASNGAIEATSNGAVKKVALTDGTLVWLKGNSKLVYYEKEEEGIRYSELKGEALYEVAKDASRPFVINRGGARVKVLGTSFSVRNSGDSLELQVLTGKVNFSTDANSTGIDLLPNERAVVVNGNVEKRRIDVEAVLAVMAGTEYNMQFVNAPLADVVTNLEKKFDANITLLNKEAGSCVVTLDLTDQSLIWSLDMITEILDVAYERQGNTVSIRGQGCP